ncbi:MAG: DHA2 family efflux MFS transporter permease subunit [Alphaproteobacteria bacterium]|nr:DHA2 family efflux MFS transporter permease subunit [Alphaproteobacteria bacterium]
MSGRTTSAEAAGAPDQPVRVIFGALILVMLLASLDQTIVSTALPRIVAEFGALAHLSWIVTAYMLATTIVTPLYGKLGDLLGRKIVLQAAIVLFLLGSALCGVAGSMGELIVFRALQGLGGGGLMVTAMAVIGDIIPPRERGRYQGLVGAVFGVSTVIGPLVGGFFVEHLSWRWIFYVNLPLGLVAWIVIAMAFRNPAERRHPKIDVPGAALLAVGLTALVLFTSLGGHTLPWSSPETIGLIAVTVLALGGFLLVERRAAEPILPLPLFANRTFVIACAVGFIVGLAMFGSITYMPIYLQVVKGVSPSTAGLQLTPMMGGVLLTSISSGQIITRVGRYRVFPIVGTAVVTLGLGLLSTLKTESSTWAASGYMLVLGMGLGMVMQVLVLAVQNAVDYRNLGVATSGNTMFRSTGGSVGVALFGAVFAAGLTSGLASRFPAGVHLPSAVDPAATAALPPTVRPASLDAFTAALHPLFLSASVIAAFAFVLTWFLREVPLRGAARSETIGESFAVPHDATSLEELEAIVGRLCHRDNRWAIFQRAADRIGIPLAPDEMWLLIQFWRRPGGTGRAAPSVAPELRDRIARRLAERGLLSRSDDGGWSCTEAGRDMVDRIVADYRTRLAEQIARWSPESHEEVRRMLAELARELVAELPQKPAARAA